MAWLDWFTSKKPAPASKAGSTDVLTTTQLDNTRPMIAKSAAGQTGVPLNTAQRLEQKRNERNAKRELLFQVVREAMVRVGVLSSAFKFKVLSLDQRGRSFLVMVELSAEFSGEVEKLADIEAMIANAAKTRYEIIVQAVYWRYFNVGQHSASAPLSATPSAATAAPVSQPVPTALSVAAQAPLLGAQHAPLARVQAPVVAPAVAPVAAPAKPTHDALEEDEVAAFRRALAAGATAGAGAAIAAVVKPTPAQPVVSQTSASTLEAARNKLLLTGYEDTEMADEEPMPALSGTQYGELR